MKKDFAISISKGRFRKLRELNRRKNYFMKEVRAIIKIYLAKIIWDKRERSTLDLKSIKKILLLRNEGTIGDMVVYSPLVNSLHEAGYIIDILLTKSSSAVMKYNPCVRNIYEAEDVCTEVYLKGFNHSVQNSITKTLGENNYDLVIDPSLFDIPVHRMKLLHEINAKSVLGFNKWKGINHYSISLSFENPKEHITKTVELIAEYMGISSLSLKPYNLHIPNDILDEVKRFLDSFKNKRKVVVNVFAGNKERCFSQEQMVEIIKHVNEVCNDVEIILLDHRNEIKIPLPDNVVINPFKTLHHVMALIHEVDLVISPDTSIVHISAAWEKPLISVYKDVDDNNDLWAPGYENASQLIVHNRLISQESNVPYLIFQEIKRRGLLENKTD